MITYGGIGDILLTTPLIAALKQAFPAAALDVYVQRGRGGMLVGNPDVRAVHESHRRHGAVSYLDYFLRHTGRYGLAVSVRTSDRQVLFARAAGRKAVSLVPGRGQNRWWKTALLSASAPQDLASHVVFDMLQLADAIGIPRVLACRVPADPASGQRLDGWMGFDWRAEPFALVHLTPRNRYKEWTPAGWRAVAGRLGQRGCRVVMVGGASEEETRAASELAAALPGQGVDLTGRASLADAALLLSRCRAYVGLDTAMTHLAAACGAPTVALYGRVIPQYMPYHEGLLETPYRTVAPRQLASRHVRVVLGRCDCRPGEAVCAAHPANPGACMQNLPADEVLAVLEDLLTEAPP